MGTMQSSYVAIFGCRSSQSPWHTLIELAMVENLRLVTGISTMSLKTHNSSDINISGFGGLIVISGCRSLSQSLRDSLPSVMWSTTPDMPLEFQCYVIVPEIISFPVWRSHCYFRLSVYVAFIWRHFL